MYVKCKACGYTYYQTEEENCPDCGGDEFSAVNDGRE
jgi:rubrerythrin